MAHLHALRPQAVGTSDDRLYPVHVKAYSVHSLYPVLDVTMPVAERAWVPSM